MLQIRIGEVVGTWAGKRKHELHKSEFRLQVQILGLDATVEDIDGIFESIDTNGNGWLDVREAGAALKQLRETAVAQAAERDAKQAECAKYKRKATRLAMHALRPPSTTARNSPRSARSGGSGGSADEDEDGEGRGGKIKMIGAEGEGGGLLGGFFSGARSERKKAEEERKKAAELRAKQALVQSVWEAPTLLDELPLLQRCVQT